MTDFETVRLEVSGSAMAVRVGRPPPRFGEGPQPTLLLAFHREGFSSFTAEVMATFAAHGWLVVVPDLYHRHPAGGWEAAYPHRRDADVLADLQATLDHLRTRADADAARLVCAGHCQGGRIALMAAATWPERFAACLSYYGGGMFEAWGEGPTAFERLHGLRCPVAAFFGELDRHPSPEEGERLEASLVGQRVPVEVHRYAEAGHAFMYRESERFRAGPAAAAWHSTFLFLERLGLQPRERG